MMNDSAQHTREENSLKPTKKVLLRKRIVVAEVCEETYSKKKYDWDGIEKMATDVINPAKIKGNAERKEITSSHMTSYMRI